MNTTSRNKGILAGVRLAAIATAFGAICTASRADDISVVDYDGLNNNYGTGNLSWSATNAPGTQDYVYAYSSTTPIIPASGYNGPVFYGGAWISSGDGSVTGLTSPGVRAYTDKNTGTAYQSVIELKSTSHTIDTGATFIDFLQPNFSGAGATSTLGVDANSSVTLNIADASASTTQFAILNNGVWYLSAESTSPTANTITEFSIADLQDSMWGVWSPTGGSAGQLGTAPTSYTVSGSTFNDIEGVGVYTAFNDTTSNQYIYIGQFGADLDTIAVPEPGVTSLILCGLAGTGVLAARRLQRTA
jgi:hypothetical protein